MEAAKEESDPVVPKYAFPVLSPRLPPPFSSALLCLVG